MALVFPRGQQPRRRRRMSEGSLYIPPNAASSSFVKSAEFEDIDDAPLQPGECYDSLGRRHWQIPRQGPTFISLRATKYRKVTAQSHANDFLDVLPRLLGERQAVAIVGDNGGDYTVKVRSGLLFVTHLADQSHKVLLSMFRVFRKLRLHLMIIVANARTWPTLRSSAHFLC